MKLRILAFCSIFFLYGCMAQPEVMMLREASDPKSPTEHIDVFYTKKPDGSYEEIAKIEVGDTDDNWNMEQIKIKAREIGADGVIIIGRVGSYVYGRGTGRGYGSFATGTTIGFDEGYGLVAIAIKYK
jgi:hypothetical protein